jgi:1-acyl-sn-glycerol-3-phosphate acyltransferase
MSRANGGVRPPLTYTQPQLNPFVLWALRRLGPLYLRRALGIRFGSVGGVEHLIEEYRRFDTGRQRLILAFRHVNPDDAQVMFTLLNNQLPAAARRRGVRFQRRPHAHFLYGRAVPLWKGQWLTWLFSRLGGVPVARDELVRANMEAVQRLLVQGRYPLAMAPEAQVTYHNELVYPLEPGFAQFAIWALRDIPEDSRCEDARILPVALHYRYGSDSAATFEHIIGEIEALSGIRVPQQCRASGTAAVLQYIGGAVLDRCEELYRRHYGLAAGRRRGTDDEPGEFSRRRVEAVTDAALKVLEQRFQLQSRNRPFLTRIFAAKQAGWKRIFRRSGDYGTVPLRDSLDDYIADEARMTLRHLEIADIMSYLQPEYALKHSDMSRAVEVALNLHDLLMRLMGGTIGDRMRIKPATAHIRIGAAISLKETRQQTRGGEKALRKRIIEQTRGELERLSLEGS